MSWEIYRYNYEDKLTMGHLYIDGAYLCDTLELPWKGNTAFISCIPEGVYNIERYTSSKHGLCVSIKNVPNRDDVEIHAANSILEIEGCIAVGLKMYEQVGHSKDTLNKLLDYLKEPTTLTIKGNLL